MKVEDGSAEAAEDEEPTATAAPVDVADGPGARLRALREARGLDLDDLAQELHLARRVLVALEADDYERLPGPTFVRGYIRSCARQLGADPEPLLEAFEGRGGRVELVVRATPRVENGRLDPVLVQRRPGLVMAGASAVMLLTFAALVLLFWPRPEDGLRTAQGAAVEAPASASVRAAPDAVADADADADADDDADAEDLVPAAGSAPGIDTIALAGTVGSTDQRENGSEPSAGADAVLAGAVPETVQRAADGALQVVAGGDDHLQFTFTGDCWVEVRDADDVAVYQDLNRAGQTLDLWGRAPFRIRLGFAPAVQLAYNDARVPLAPHTRNDVANLVIGR